MRIFSSELKLKRNDQKLCGIFSQKLSDMGHHGVHFGNDEWAVVYSERLFIVDSEIQVPDAGQ